GHLGPRGGEVVRALVGLFEAERSSSGRAAKALAAMEAGDWGQAVVGALVRSIRQGPEWETGGYRYNLLGNMARDSAGGPSIAGLLDLLRDGDPRVREGAATACRAVERGPEEIEDSRPGRWYTHQLSSGGRGQTR